MPDDSSTLDRARLRWRARRGLLENDLMLTRFLDAHEADLSDAQVAALSRLLQMDDTELLDVLLGRIDLRAPYDEPAIRRLVQQIQAI